MLCESILWSMTYCSDQERLDPLPPVIEPPTSSVRAGSQPVKAAPLFTLQASPGQPSRKGHSILPRVAQDQRPSRVSAQIQPQGSSLQQALHSQRPHPGRHISPEMEIPGQARSGGDVPFLVPSSCQSICQNYSDLHIGGDQVLPLSDHDGELLPCSDTQADGPFLYSCDVLPAADDSPPDRASEDRPLCPLQGGSGLGSSRWRAGSDRYRSFLLQGCEGPLSNSLLNRYLEHKLLDLYQQYMLESMAREGGCNEGFPSHLLASELLLTSLDQITLQLSREGHLEAGRAKDMVLSCLLRVASGLQSSEISTPLLQISTDLQLPTATAAAATVTTAVTAATVTTAVTSATSTTAVTAATSTTAVTAATSTTAVTTATSTTAVTAATSTTAVTAATVAAAVTTATVTTAVTAATVAAASTSTTTAAGAAAGGLGAPQGQLTSGTAQTTALRNRVVTEVQPT